MGTARRQSAYRFGLVAENVAALYLMMRGYRIIGRRYKTKYGEIDIIARKKSCVIFAEVKGRRDLSTALEAVTPRARKRIMMAANSFMAKHPRYQHYDMRFDVLAVRSLFSITHVDNAWFTTM